MGDVDEYLGNGYGFLEISSAKYPEAPWRRSDQIHCKSHYGIRVAQTYKRRQENVSTITCDHGLVSCGNKTSKGEEVVSFCKCSNNCSYQ